MSQRHGLVVLLSLALGLVPVRAWSADGGVSRGGAPSATRTSAGGAPARADAGAADAGVHRTTPAGTTSRTGAAAGGGAPARAADGGLVRRSSPEPTTQAVGAPDGGASRTAGGAGPRADGGLAARAPDGGAVRGTTSHADAGLDARPHDGHANAPSADAGVSPASDGGLAARTPDAGLPLPHSTWDPLHAGSFSDATRAAFDAIVREWRTGGPNDALSVAVVQDDRVWLAAYGPASLSPRKLATSATSYRIGSLTKTFTAVATLRLAAAGQVKLDDDVRTYVPRFPEKPWPVTVRELLGHTGGLGWYRSPRDAWTTSPTTTAQALDLFKDRALAFEPGSAFLYSSFGYVLLGATVERASGLPYAEYLERTIWGPLGLTHTGLEASAKTMAARASGYRLAKGKLVNARKLDLSSRFSSGGLRSTVEDLARWAHALMAGDVVDAATWQAMTTPGVTTTGEVTDYGLGFAAYPVRGRKVVAHAGGVPGAAALLLLVPEDRFAVVLLSNLQNQAGGEMDLATRLAEVVLDDGLPRHRWTSTSRADEVAFDGMSRVLSHGLVRLREPSPPPGASLDEAFKTLGTLFHHAHLVEDPQAARLALKEAYHPRRGRISAVAGAEMARLLESRGQRVRDYTGARGPAAFFVDYARACAATSCAHPLPRDLAALAERLDAEWQRTPSLLLRLRREQYDDAPGLADALREMERLPAHIDVVEDLTRLAWRHRAAGNLEASRETLALSARLHPESPLAMLALAESAALDGDAAAAGERLREAAVLTRPGLTRDLVKTRAEVLQVGATPEGVAALDALVAKARTLLPPVGASAARHLARDPSPTRAAPDLGDEEPAVDAGQPSRGGVRH